MKVLFLQTVHPEDDDRVRYHQRMSLTQAGHECDYACGLYDAPTSAPDVVICDTPRAVFQARKAFGRRSRVVYDITEWYPSKKNLRSVPLLLKPLKFCALALANWWAGCAADAFLFGEYYKARPFKRLFPWKRSLLLPYYPSLQYIPHTSPVPLDHEVRVLYAGPQTEEKGFFRAQQLAEKCQTLLPERKILFTAIDKLPFEQFCQEITKHDIFVDLRDVDAENTRCLPIKLFYYMAAGRPVIYSDLQAIRQGVPELSADSLVSPDALDEAAKRLVEWITNAELYQMICARNRQLAETQYNWERQSKAFIRFIEQL